MRTFLVLLLTLYCFPVHAASHDMYSDTVQSLFARLENIDIEKVDKTNKLEMHLDDKETFDEAPKEMDDTKNVQASEKEDEVVHIKPLPDSFKGSILDRIQSESTVSLKNMTDGVDKISTTFYNFITRGLIGLSPILLIIGAVLVLFSRGRAIGAILFVGVGLFVIFNAPELMQAFLSFITGIFK